MRVLRGKVAVVTGAASGIGRGLCLALAGEGVRVVAADREEGPLVETVAMVRERGGEALGLPADVTEPAAVVALADRAYDEFGEVHLLFNNAGVFAGGFAWETTDDDWAWILAVNVRGVVNGIRAFVPRMLGRGTEGHVVNTASMAGIVSAPLSSPYCASKFAVVGLSECLWHDLSLQPDNRIGVSVVVPSAVATGIARSERLRPSVLAGTTSDGARTVQDALAQATAAGVDPVVAARRILAGVQAGDFYIPTSGGFARQCGIANDTRVRKLPPQFQMFE